MEKPQHILIIGAGLCGSLLALRLAQRGHQVELIEKREDLRKTTIAAGRSINLALSNRGLKAMRLVGLEEKVQQLCIPMKGRMIHPLKSDTFLSRYSGLEEEYINSISRPGLNALLLDEAEKMNRVSITFSTACTAVDVEKTEATFQNLNTGEKLTKKATIIIGTDGAGSVVRQSMLQKSHFLFDYTQKFLSHGYKELHIPAGEGRSFQLFKNALHIWPRKKDMIIALPNIDGSFTVTLFMAYKDGKHNFDTLDTPQKVRAYFDTQYPDAAALMPNLEKVFFENPTGILGMIKCAPWHYQDNVLLMGDSAHAVVPFYGQGMNASFEDVTVFDQFLDTHSGTWESLFSAYTQQRKIDTDAIGDLSLDNFEEMMSDTASPLFQQKRALETALEQTYPKEYSAKYRLVAFQESIGYAEAMRQGRAQDKAMFQLLTSGKIAPNHSLKDKLDLIKKTTLEILKSENYHY